MGWVGACRQEGDSDGNDSQGDGNGEGQQDSQARKGRRVGQVGSPSAGQPLGLPRLGGRALHHPLFLFCACQEGGDDEQEVFKQRLSAMSPKARKNYALGLMAALRGDRDRRTEKRGWPAESRTPFVGACGPQAS